MPATADARAWRIPLNVIDEVLALSETPAEPWSVHVEARVAGRLDEARLRAAVRSALQRHPIARARLVERGARLYWLVDPDPAREALSACEAHDRRALDAVRAAFLTGVVPLDAAPPLRLRLVRTAGGDHLLLSIHHAASDGIGALRLLQSIARAYAGAADAVFAGDALAERRLEGLAPPGGGGAVWSALDGIGRCLEALAPASRVARDGATDRAGYGVQVRALALAPIEQGAIRRAVDATVNDVLLAALHRAVAGWNRDHGVGSERLSVLVPINGRGPRQQPALVGNFTMTDAVSTGAADRRDAGATLQAVSRQTRRLRRAGAPFADLVPRFAGWPTRLARQAPWLFRGPRVHGPGDCAVFSNLGRGDRMLASFDADLPVTGLWFSPPVSSPVGVALGAISGGGAIHLTLRHRWPRLDGAAAGRLLDRIVAECAAYR